MLYYSNILETRKILSIPLQISFSGYEILTQSYRKPIFNFINNHYHYNYYHCHYITYYNLLFTVSPKILLSCNIVTI